jgi:hypothetical protein
VSGKTLLLGLIPVLGLTALTYHFMSDAETHTPATLSPPPSQSDSASKSDSQPVAATGRIAAKRSTQKQQQAGNREKLALPDGTFVDALNGAIDSPPMSDFWGPFDWSPIVGIERSSADVDWYKHADGSYSTTEMVMRTDLGRKAAMTRVAHPGPTPATTSPR